MRGFLIGLAGVATIWSGSSCFAQISVGVSRQGGIVTGASLQVGGLVSPGRTGVRLGVSNANRQLRGIQTFSFQSGVSNGRVTNNQRSSRMTPGRFARAARRFDRNDDELLDPDELAAIGIAVFAELEQRRTPASQRSSVRVRPAVSKEDPQEDPQVKAFVKHCLRFDRDKDGVLSRKETSRMAKAFIRSLG